MTNRWKEQYDVDATEAVEMFPRVNDEFRDYPELNEEIEVAIDVQEQLQGYIRRGR